MTHTPAVFGPSCAEHTSGASLFQLLDWLAAADQCQLDALRTRCTCEVAQRQASSPCGLAGSLVDAQLVAERCDKGTLAQLLGLALDAGKSRQDGQPLSIASEQEAGEALLEAAEPGIFAWELGDPGLGACICPPSLSRKHRHIGLVWRGWQAVALEALLRPRHKVAPPLKGRSRAPVRSVARPGAAGCLVKQLGDFLVSPERALAQLPSHCWIATAPTACDAGVPWVQLTTRRELRSCIDRGLLPGSLWLLAKVEMVR